MFSLLIGRGVFYQKEEDGNQLFKIRLTPESAYFIRLKLKAVNGTTRIDSRTYLSRSVIQVINQERVVSQ
jgi:hypothetical protein